ncbi:MFS transporter [Tateyamaria sp. ANG-S1]|uniref:MFS transporter n=1 Tax=Tateyamaria sp. ANG-S1 TaxID=1577905 RepID=UPI00057F41F5|nr:MFS transporter [Tateyamaria sp. ANG-S1]KIC49606.1 MFS transporter [Tateyamaria sp. ANG-S1]
MADISLKKRIWGWFFFDWASQPYHTVLLTFIFGPFFVSLASENFLAQGIETEQAKADAQAMWSYTLTITGLIIGFGAPLLGAMADTGGRRIPWIIGFSLMLVAGASSLWFTAPDGSNLTWMLIAFAFGFIGAEFALIFINAQLPDLGTEEEIGKISGSGFSFGYAGGVLSLIVLLLLFVEQPNGKTLIGLDPLFGILDAETREGTRSTGPIVAIWFAVFMIPYFLWVRDRNPKGRRTTVGAALSQLWGTVRNLPAKPSLFTYLGSSMLYRDALNGLYSFGGTFALLVLDFSVVEVGVFGIVAAIGASIFSYVGGIADKRFGPKPVVITSIWVLMGVCFMLVNLSRDSMFGIALPEGSPVPDLIFYVCGVLIGGMGGVIQSASRTLMVRHSNPNAPTESFGLYGLSGRATAFMAPFLIGVATTATGSTQLGVSPLLFLFLAGLIMLRWVNPKGEV